MPRASNFYAGDFFGWDGVRVVDVVSERCNPNPNLIIRATTSLIVILVDIAQEYARSHRHCQLVADNELKMSIKLQLKEVIN